MENASISVIDSSVFVAFYRDIDSHNREAIAIMQELAAAGVSMIVHPYVVQETATVLAYSSGLDIAKRFLSDLAEASNAVVPVVAIQHDMQLYTVCDVKISFTDCALIGLAKEMNARLITFDRQMLAYARRL